MDVDQELQRALDVEPSPEFLARVRMRIADEPAPRRWGSAWMFAAAAAAAAVIVAVVVTRSTSERKESLELLASRTLPMIEMRPPVGAELARPAAGRPGAEQAPPLQVPAGDRTAAAINVATPEILVDARESATLRRLMAAVGARQVDLRAVLKPGPFATTDAEPIRDLLITPISIEPLEPTSEGARQ